MNPALLSSKNMCWCTPQDFFNELNAEFTSYLTPQQQTKRLENVPYDLGGGQLTIHCRYGNILPTKSNAIYYKGNMTSSGVELRINGRHRARFVPPTAEDDRRPLPHVLQRHAVPVVPVKGK